MSTLRPESEGRGIHRLEIPSLRTQESKETFTKTEFLEARLPMTAEEQIASIERILNDPKTYIDRGGAAAVHRLSSESVCLKIFFPHKDVERRLTGIDFVRKEATMTKFLNSFKIAGVRSPRCVGYYSFDKFDGRSGLVLEELDAVNLQHIILGHAKAPASFNPENYMDALYEYIDALHEQKNILHGDLFARNVMVDRATGLPRVIDFGESLNLNNLSREQKSAKISEEIKRLDDIDNALTS